MSRIANTPIRLPESVEFRIDEGVIRVKGPKGELTQALHPQVAVHEEIGTLFFTPRTQERRAIAFAGTMRALVNNMVVGVTEGFERNLEINGVGYRADLRDNTLTCQLGFAHPVEYKVPAGVDVEVTQNTRIAVRGIDKALVGQVAADIRNLRPPEPYKGKGVRLTGEPLIRKEAKKK